MKSQTSIATKTKTHFTKEQAEKAWRELSIYRDKLKGADLAKMVAQDRSR